MILSTPRRKEPAMKHSRDPLFAPPRRRHPALGFIVLLIVVLAAIGLVLNHVNNSRVDLLTQSVTVPSLPSSLENFRILHISDLHGLMFGAHQERLALTLAPARYDIVCVTGDVTAPDGSIDAFLELLDLFHGKVPVYFIPGDEDPEPILNTPHAASGAKADYILAAEAHGAIFLDAPEKITAGRGTLWLCPASVYTLDVAGSESAYTARQAELAAQPSSPQSA